MKRYSDNFINRLGGWGWIICVGIVGLILGMLVSQ
jgi:uncharacterized membrane protein HdeD (DUF308 family)